jgi:hypothetical protein
MARTLYTLEVSILDGLMTDGFIRDNPVVSRTIEIRGDQTLNQLHRAIFEAFDRWDDCHLSEFHLGRKPRDRHAKRYVLPFIYDDPEDFDEPPAAGSVTQTRLGGLDLKVGSVFWYWYDFGDNWYHEIRVLAIGKAEPKGKYPRAVAVVGESPLQYVDWDVEGEDEEAFPEDWVAEILEGHPTIGTAEMGMVPVEDDGSVSWIRWQISGEQASLARDLTTQRVYHVTTVRGLADGTSVLTTYIVRGVYLAPWLEVLTRAGEEPETVLSVEVV